MNKVKEIARIKGSDVSRIELARKEIGITQKFIAECLGLQSTTYSQWVTQAERIPEKYVDELIHILTTLWNLRFNYLNAQGAEKIQARKQKVEIDKETYDEIVEFLNNVSDPKVSVLDISSREEMLEKTIENYIDSSKVLLTYLND